MTQTLHWKHTLELGLLLSAFVFPAVAEEPGFDDFDNSAGFEIPTTDKKPEQISPWRFTTSYNVGMGLEAPQAINSHRVDLRLQWEKLLSNKYYLTLDGKVLGRLSGDQQLNAGETVTIEGRLRSLYVQTSSEAWSLKAGYQLVTLGKMDMIPVVDVLSPWDYSGFAFTAPEDARVSQPWINFTHHYENSTLGFLINSAPSVNRYPGGTATSLLALQLGNNNFTLDVQPPRTWNDVELGVIWSRSQGKRDSSVMLASVLQDGPLIELINPSPPAPIPGFRATYPRYSIFGLSTNVTYGNFLWKAEMAYKHGLQFFDMGMMSLLTANSLSVAGGFDYTAGGRYIVSVEAGQQHIFLPGASTLPTDNTQIAARFSKNFHNETVSTVYYISYQLQDRNITQSAALKYAITDDISIELVGTVFQIGDKNSIYAFTDSWDQLALKLSISQ